MFCTPTLSIDMVKISGLVDLVNRSNVLEVANVRLTRLRQHHDKQTNTIKYKTQDCSAQNKVSGQQETSNWLSSLTERLTTNVALEAKGTRTSTSSSASEEVSSQQIPSSIRVYPSLLASMLRAMLVPVGRIWLLAKMLDSRGCGWIDIQQLKVHLTNKSSPLRVCSWRRLRQIIQQGQHILWERDEIGRIWLYGPKKVANKLNVHKLAGKAVFLPINTLTKGITHVKATFYAAFHAGRPSAPISRATLSSLVGVSERSQRTYDHLGGVQRQTNFCIDKASKQQSQHAAAYTAGNAHFIFEDRKGTFGRKGQKFNAYQLPNTYLTTLQTLECKKQRKLNQQLQTDLVKQEAQGNSLQFKRYYILDAGALQRNKKGKYIKLTNFKHSHTIWCSLND